MVGAKLGGLTEDQDFERGWSDYGYMSAAFFMALGMIVSLYHWIAGENREKRLIAAMCFSLNLAECICFLALRYRLSTAASDPHLGTPVEHARYLEWSYGPTCLIVIFSKITQSKRSIAVPIISWLIMVWLGYASMLFPFDVSRNLAFPAHMAFVYALVKIWTMFEDALAMPKPPVSREILRLLQVHCMIAWSIFTVVFCFQIAPHISAQATEVWYALSSTVTKFPFTLIILNTPISWEREKTKTQ